MGRRQQRTRRTKNYFVPVDSDSFRRKRSRGWASTTNTSTTTTRPPWNPIAFLLRPLARLFSKKSKQSSFDDSASPDRTALMSFEELSSYSATTTEQQRDLMMMDAVMEKFPSWHSFSIAVDTTDTTTEPADAVPKPAKPRGGRLTRTLQRFREQRPSDDTTTDEDSQHFSISTDLRQSAPRNVNITISNSFNSYTNTTIAPPPGRVSLEQFMMADSVQNLTSSIVLPLGEVGSIDESTLLGVSYDEDYPQLVLQASSSLDGGHSRLATTHTASHHLGAHYGHPAAAADTPTTSSWLDRSLEDMWGTTQLLANDDDETSSSSSSSSFDAPMTMMSEWMDEAVAEFSITDSVKSLSEMLEKDVVQPVMEFCQPSSKKPKKRRILFRIMKPKAS